MNAERLRAMVKAELEQVTAIRHDLHQHPELSFAEKRTSGVVQRELAALSVRHMAGLGGVEPNSGTGVLGYLPATTNPGSAPTIALRADMDALPILEETGRGYASKTPGVMHACGHDGHTSILLGAARVLSKTPERPNNVLLVFQPAEEGGAGAEKMCRDGALDGRHFGKPVDAIFGLHGWPDQALGTVATRSGPMLAATDDFEVIIHGLGCHAAQPHVGLDPIVAAAHVVVAIQTIASRRFSPFEPVVVTVGQFNAGSANNIIPERATIHGTIRTLTAEARKLAEEEFRRVVAQTAAGLGCRAEIRWHTGYPVTHNDPGATERFRRVAAGLMGPERLLERTHPTMGGEDFAYYGRHANASFFFLGLCPAGQSTSANLHTPGFDFNDSALPLGIGIMSGLALDPAEA